MISLRVRVGVRVRVRVRVWVRPGKLRLGKGCSSCTTGGSPKETGG